MTIDVFLQMAREINIFISTPYFFVDSNFLFDFDQIFKQEKGQKHTYLIHLKQQFVLNIKNLAFIQTMLYDLSMNI